jgi:enoyl-CoA hydratase/carnithine racemase
MTNGTANPSAVSGEYEFEDVVYEVSEGVAILTLNRPENRNGMRLRLMWDIEAALVRADGDPDVRALVVTGAGASFCVGAELSGPDSLVRGMIDDEAGHTASGYREPAGRISERISRMRVPVIGAVNGDAVGGGATILTAMDVRIAADNARFGFVFTRRGVVPEGASTWFLPRLVGHGRATDWLLSGRVFDAAEALESGFVSRLLPAAEVLPAALEYARQFVSKTSPASVAHTRRLLAESWRALSPGEAAINESNTYASIVDTPDAREGVLSFIEKRHAEFVTTGIPQIDNQRP